MIEPQSTHDLQNVRSLFEEYWSYFGFTPCFQNFAAEVLSLPGDTRRPEAASS